tara:strand:+ start:74514 stop:74939 length:426 start_codon:yes stop_codon:yes gene_type:complete
MADIHRILADHRPKSNNNESPDKQVEDVPTATHSEIPDLFFDEVLVKTKFTRLEIVVFMYIYRRTWCRPNLHKEFGISQLLSHNEMAHNLSVEIDQVLHALRRLEELNFISTIRSGQYFIRKYFTKENDDLYGQNYHDFEL